LVPPDDNETSFWVAAKANLEKEKEERIIQIQNWFSTLECLVEQEILCGPSCSAA
jgi:hypothetical protein